MSLMKVIFRLLHMLYITVIAWVYVMFMILSVSTDN